MSETTAKTYDLAIIGGGLAGLGLSILMARKGYSVILYEQKKYPFHRVCGEYIAMESWPLLRELGLPIDEMSLPQIKRLLVSAPNGQSLDSKLCPGGFGISRYRLDYELSRLAHQAGVDVLEQTRIRQVSFEGEGFKVSDGKTVWYSRLACGAFGKFSNLDQHLRSKELPHVRGYPTFVGVKYHIRTRFPQDLIALHNFTGGYCGISAIEDDALGERYNLCYLMRAEAFRSAGAQPEKVAECVLSQNPYLKSIFENAEFIFDRPLSIAQIHFRPRAQVIDHLLLLGDAGGLIPPLCGNGMSMALHAARILESLIEHFFEGGVSRLELEQAYQKQWRQNFALRLKAGRFLQHVFGRNLPIQSLIQTLKPLPGLSEQLISWTHGKDF